MMPPNCTVAPDRRWSMISHDTARAWATDHRPNCLPSHRATAVKRAQPYPNPFRRGPCDHASRGNQTPSASPTRSNEEVYLLLSFQFRSYLEPVVVMAAIPLAPVGVVVGHFVLGIESGMPSMLGFVSLASTVLVLLVVLMIAAIEPS